MTNPAPTPSLFKHGSTWLRADFHLHTLADKEFRTRGTQIILSRSTSQL